MPGKSNSEELAERKRLGYIKKDYAEQKLKGEKAFCQFLREHHPELRTAFNTIDRQLESREKQIEQDEYFYSLTSEEDNIVIFDLKSERDRAKKKWEAAGAYKIKDSQHRKTALELAAPKLRDACRMALEELQLANGTLPDTPTIQALKDALSSLVNRKED